VHSLVGMSGNLSTGKCIGSDAPLLDSLLVTQHNHQIREVVSVGWKAPSAPWLKVNSNDSVIGNHGACGGLFRDHLGNFLGAFTCNLGISFVFTVEVHSFILAMEYAAQNGWTNIWLESDSTSALLVFKNRSLVPDLLRNGWHNACSLGIHIISSHIFREGNCYADKLANMGHSVHGAVWLSTLPLDLQAEFYSRRCGMPRYR